jgi:hypothetical protein
VTVGCGWIAPVVAEAQSDYTWSGAAVSTSASWSDGGNWTGAMAPTPSESLGTVTFRQLSGCSSFTSCGYVSRNDVSGLSATGLSVADTAGYEISGQALALGSGGLSAEPGSPVNTAAPDVS